MDIPSWESVPDLWRKNRGDRIEILCGQFVMPYRKPPGQEDGCETGFIHKGEGVQYGIQTTFSGCVETGDGSSRKAFD